MTEASRQLRVFVVDDEETIASSLAMILHLHGGLHATSFTDPLEALDLAQSEKPDLLISDVMMPHLSGVDLAIRFKVVCPGCKVLLFSGHTATRQLVKEAESRGYAFELLEKPVHPADLLGKIRSLADEPGLSPRQP